jgi:hypothetical protein
MVLDMRTAYTVVHVLLAWGSRLEPFQGTIVPLLEGRPAALPEAAQSPSRQYHETVLAGSHGPEVSLYENTTSTDSTVLYRGTVRSGGRGRAQH